MTKERITFTVSKELYEVVAFRASAKQMNLSEYLESRLRMVPEILKQIEVFQNLPEDPIVSIKKDEIDPSIETRPVIFSKSTKKLEKDTLVVGQ